MAHTSRNKDQLLNRIRRIRGQLNAVEAGVEREAECTTVLHTLVACRGALNSLVVEMFEDHLRYHVVDPKKRPTAQQAAAAQEMVELLKACL
jgi:DNA-binding FrmR family transcriptional regulator